MHTPRVYLTGRMAVEHGPQLVTEAALPGRQGRLAFAYLFWHRDRPVGRSELEEVIWPDGLPPGPDAAFNAILSKLRAALSRVGFSRRDAIGLRSGAVEIQLPTSVWIDVEEAGNAVDLAEGALRAGDAAGAWGFANVTVSIARRPFLVEHEAPWIEACRITLRRLLARGLQCLVATSELRRDASQAILFATQLMELEPFREATYRRLMRLHASMGDRAEAVRVFANCRSRLEGELGVRPSPETEAVYRRILDEGGD